LAVSNTTAGSRARQTFEYFAYQPGHGALISMTGVIGSPATGITRRIGQFDANNGVYFESGPTALAVVIRSNTSGSPVNTSVTQNNWNIDKLDGTGVSGITLDASKSQIFTIKYQWLGVGSVTYGFNFHGVFYPCHRVDNSNTLTTVYMSMASLPLRYEITNDGTGGVASIVHICCSVISEGGAVDPGNTLAISRDAPLTTLNNNSYYPVMAMSHQSGRYMINVNIDKIDIFCPSNAVYVFKLLLNPTITGTALSFTNLTNSAIMYDISRTNATTVSGGTTLLSGIGDSTTNVALAIRPQTIRLGRTIAGVDDILVLAVSRITGTAEAFYASIVWQEY
jgi:hypothetical protein